MDYTYIRVGTKYYKIIEVPDLKGKSFEQRIVPWSKENIIDDHNKKKIHEIPKFDSFTTVPDHLNYKQVVGNCYNLYHPLPHQPAYGDLSYTKKFLSHVFGDQLELAYDYFALLLLKPVEILPVLALVSNEPSTGKSTLVKWLKEIFGHNMTINSNDEFRSRFNSDWTSKLIIAIEETLLDRREDSERIKNLSTANIVKTESKGIDKVEVPFFGKLILCSNNETNFVYISQDEIRYWVRKLKPIKENDPFMLDRLVSEIPSFMYFLITRGIQYEKKSRMWFLPKDIFTDALQRLKDDNASLVEKEIKEIVSELMLTYDLEEISFTVTDLLALIRQGGIRQVNNHYISSILKDKWGLIPIRNPSTYRYYFQHSISFEQSYETRKGRFYTFSREKILDSSKNFALKSEEMK